MTIPPLNVSEEMRVKMPLKTLLALLAVVAAGAIAWASTRSDVAGNTRRIDKLEVDQNVSRELLIRIDENVKALKERSPR